MSCRYVGVTVSILVVNVVVNFLSQVIFLFLWFLVMVMYANEVERKEKEKLPDIKKLTTISTMIFSRNGLQCRHSSFDKFRILWLT